MHQVPLSKFKRELRKILRFLESHPDQVVYVLRSKKVVFVLVGIEHFYSIVSIEEN